MPLSNIMKRRAEDEVRLWATETGHRLSTPGEIRELSVETLYRRLTLKYPEEMTSYTIDDVKESTFEDGDYFNDNWFHGNTPPGTKTIADDGRMPGSGQVGDQGSDAESDLGDEHPLDSYEEKDEWEDLDDEEDESGE